LVTSRTNNYSGYHILNLTDLSENLLASLVIYNTKVENEVTKSRAAGTNDIRQMTKVWLEAIVV
jgi:hypothetical protein